MTFNFSKTIILEDKTSCKRGHYKSHAWGSLLWDHRHDLKCTCPKIDNDIFSGCKTELQGFSLFPEQQYNFLAFFMPRSLLRGDNQNCISQGAIANLWMPSLEFYTRIEPATPLFNLYMIQLFITSLLENDEEADCSIVMTCKFILIRDFS